MSEEKPAKYVGGWLELSKHMKVLIDNVQMFVDNYQNYGTLTDQYFVNKFSDNLAALHLSADKLKEVLDN